MKARLYTLHRKVPYLGEMRWFCSRILCARITLALTLNATWDYTKIAQKLHNRVAGDNYLVCLRKRFRPKKEMQSDRRMRWIRDRRIPNGRFFVSWMMELLWPCVFVGSKKARIPRRPRFFFGHGARVQSRALYNCVNIRSRGLGNLNDTIDACLGDRMLSGSDFAREFLLFDPHPRDNGVLFSAKRTRISDYARVLIVRNDTDSKIRSRIC